MKHNYHNYIDINCDLGEGIENEYKIVPYISSANIACGYHAGNEIIIEATLNLCKKNGVAIGAHPSYNDKANFGRKSHSLSEAACYQLVTAQLQLFNAVAIRCQTGFTHVKPHGALYNDSAVNAKIAMAIAKAVYDFNPQLKLYGLSGSASIAAAKQVGLAYAQEVFADRAYQKNGQLVPRSAVGALLLTNHAVANQLTQMLTQQQVTSICGHTITIEADTVCLHGDHVQAVEFAQLINNQLQILNIEKRYV